MTFVCDLGVLIDVESTLKQRVSKLTSSCSCQLRRLREVRKYVNWQVLKQLVHAFIISRLDYCNCIFASLPKCLILHSSAPTSPECRRKIDILIVSAWPGHDGFAVNSLAISLLPDLIHMVSVNVLCLSSTLPGLHQRQGSVCRHLYPPSGSPVFHMPYVRRTENSYETRGACVFTFRTCGVECIAIQYP